ncbi:MAG: hypothetical protein ABI222_03380 [Opitutaceae bacterium]
MLAIIYLLLVGVLAYQLQSRVALLEAFKGLPRYLCSLGLALFLVNWVNFLLFAIVGWSPLYLPLSWGVLVTGLIYFSGFWRVAETRRPRQLLRSVLSTLRPVRDWNFWFLFLAVFVGARFYAGLDVDAENNVWSLFNFVDTAFHLSVVNAFLAAPHFPPMDLDMAPYPLKYHFLADFNVAHLARLGLPALSGIWLMNLISSLVMVGAIWATFERWLKLPPRWVMLAGLIFLFLNTALVNLIHFAVFQPPFFEPDKLFYGLLRFPYFNFESAQANMLEPQRGLLFSLPIVLLILQAAFGEPPETASGPRARIRTLEAFALVCLLPLAHIVAFAVMAPSLLPSLWRHGKWFGSRLWIWLPVFLLGVLQLFYLGEYGPATNAGFSSWSANSFLPLQDYFQLPAVTRGAAFWFFANGDFLFWGLLFAAGACAWGRRYDPAAPRPSGLWPFLVAWRWYFTVCGGFFLLINFYRYSYDWGDSNKLVFFLNLGLTLVITLGAAQWLGRRQQVLSQALWVFFLALCVAPPSYAFYMNILKSGHGAGTVLLFEKNGRQAAAWLDETLAPTDIVLTAAYNTMHFVTPLAGQPTLAGIYGDANPYRQDNRQEEIRRIYENGELPLLNKLGIRYVCISRNERRKYQLSPRWIQLMTDKTGVVFQVGEGPDDYHSVYIFDARQLAPK